MAVKHENPELAKAIDWYYEELGDGQHSVEQLSEQLSEQPGEQSGEQSGEPPLALLADLSNALARMDVLRNLDLGEPTDLMSIIAAGEAAREQQARREEGVTFAAAASIIVSSLAIWSYLFGPELMLALQMGLVSLATLVVMPLIGYFEGGKNNE